MPLTLTDFYSIWKGALSYMLLFGAFNHQKQYNFSVLKNRNKNINFLYWSANHGAQIRAYTKQEQIGFFHFLADWLVCLCLKWIFFTSTNACSDGRINSTFSVLVLVLFTTATRHSVKWVMEWKSLTRVKIKLSAVCMLYFFFWVSVVNSAFSISEALRKGGPRNRRDIRKDLKEKNLPWRGETCLQSRAK